MKQILKLVFLLVIGQTAFAQAPSNYTNINGRYRWIAGMFDSTFHIPKGSTPSLRTGGSTNSGGLFYNTSDSSVYTYTGTQWIKLRGSINPSDTTNKYVTQVYKKSGSDSIFYVKGGVHTWAFNDSTGSPGGGGGGKVYYFNGGVSMGTFGGFTMYELGDTANTGAAANFTRSTTGNIANFITDPGKPGLLQIPAGVWSVDAWLSETGGGANHAEIWVEVEKWDGSTITTIATSPIEQITEGATPNLYSWSVSIPTTSLTVTDRIIIQFYISNTNGKTVTLYTQNGYVGEVHTTFTTGIGAINGLTAPAQYLVTGTSGTDFNINSSTATHTFNLPTASATNRGALSTTDWSTFNNKIGGSLVSGYLTKATGTNTIDTSQIYQSNGKIGIGRTNPTAKVDVYDSLGTSIKSTMRAQINTDVALDVKTVGNRGFALIIDQADSVASGTQYQTLFRKSMMPGTGNPANGGGVSWYTQIGNDNNVYRALSVYRARVIDSTGFANSNIQQTSTEFWTRKAGVWDTTLVLNGGNVGINTGQNGIDSALTVANGTWLMRGVRMSALPTGVGTKALRIDANGTLSVADTLANPISGTGTTNYVTKWTSSSAVGNSQIFDNGTNVGIGTNTPTRTLDVNGIITTNNNLELTSANPTILWTTSNLRFYNNTNGVVATISSAGQLSLSSIPNATTDTDKFLVSDGGVVKYRTGSEVLSDIGAASSSSISGTTNYIPKFTSSSAIGNSIVQDYGDNVWVGSNTAGYGTLNIQRFTSAPYATLTLTDQATSSNEVGIYLRANGSNPVGISSAGAPIAFYTGGPASNERMRLTSGGLLGIGTSSPQAPLHTYGGGTVAKFGALGVTTYDNFIIQSYADATYIGTEGTSPLGFIVGSSEKMRLDASGNLLVGNTSSAVGEKLNVTGFGIAVERTDGGSTLLLGHFGGNDGVIGTYTNDNLTFRTNNTERMRLDASGNLGLGVTPSAWTGTGVKAFQFQNGSLAASSSFGTWLSWNAYYDGSDKYVSSSTAGRYLIEGNVHRWDIAPSGTAGNAISFTQAMTLDASGRLGIGTTSPTNGKLEVVGGVTQLGSTTAYINSRFNSTAATVTDRPGIIIGYDTNGGGVIAGSTEANGQPINFWTFNGSSWGERMRITSGGNVGIGSSSPSATAKLSVYTSQSGSSPNPLLRLENTGTSYQARMVLTDGTTADGIIAFQGGVTAATQYLGFGIGSTPTQMVLTGGGNVGIGTTSPTSRLHIYGTTDATQRIIADGSGNNSSLHLNYNGSNVGFINSYQNTELNIGTSVSAFVNFYTNNSERMRITSGGTLLVNAQASTYGAASGYMFGVKGTANQSFISIARTGQNLDSQGMIIGLDATIGYLSIIDNLPLSFITNNTERMRITSGGNVGIGTSNPTYTLDTYGGEVRFKGSSTYMTVNIDNNSTNGGGGIYLRQNGTIGAGIGLSGWYLGGTSSDLFLNSETGRNIRFAVNAGTEAMRITSGGELLINTTSDAGDYKLQVNGNTLTSGSITTAAPSGGTAAAWKLGERVASSGVTFNDQQYIQLDIGGTLYYLATVDLPMPEAYPQATSGPSNNYKMAPVQVKTTRDAEIEKLRKEIEELKQLIKNK